ncbi:MAG: serine/threonine-protein kinase [Planctomycetota bacterium]
MKTPAEIRARLSEDLANGKTIVLSTRELDDPSLREQLPQLLEDLSATHAPKPGVGPQIPGYTMLGEIGQGGMSTVYLARQEKLGRHVAVKVAPAWLGGGERARRMLVQEAQAMARLQHPNIVVIHDIIDVDDTFAIAMEWVDGRTLASLLRTLPTEPGRDDMVLLTTALGTSQEARETFEQSSVRHFVRLIRDVALAVQAVHDAELLHLDIKPSNVLIRRDGTPLLADFGVTREISPEPTQTRTFAGTPVYAAPEQLRRDDDQIGPRTDVYSLGVTLYEALARTQPLRGLDLPGIVQCVESGSMPPLSSKVAVPPDLANIVHRAIAPEPEHRYATAQALADDLDAFLEHRPVQARPLTRTQRLRRWMRNEPWKAALAATLAVMVPALLVLGTYLAVQMPTIFAAEVRDRQEQVNQLKQDAFQRFLTSHGTHEYAILPLERALAIDPGKTALASLLALTNERGWPHLDELLERERTVIEAEASLRMVRDKAMARRSFFSDEELDTLREQETALARYVVALDRVFHANDERSQSSRHEAHAALEAAAMQDAPDPLLLGLLLWNSARLDDTETFDSVARLMRRRWPNDAVALTWASIAIEPSDADLALQRAEQVIERTPGDVYGYEVCAANRMRAKDVDGVQKFIERARSAGLTSPLLDIYAPMTAARNGDVQQAQALLAHQRQDLLPDGTRLLALRTLSHEQAVTFARSLVAQAAPSPGALKQAAMFDYKERELSESAIARFFELYPDRRSLHPHAIMMAWPQRGDDAREAMRRIADLGREASLEGMHIENVVHMVMRAHIFLREWDELRRHAMGCLEDAPDSQQTYYYAALGLSRLGEYLEAGRLLARGVASEPEARTGRPPSWYVAALLDDAWLRASPESAPQLHDPELARVRLQAFDRLNPELQIPHRGPWLSLTRAEVLWSNGERDAAREAIRSAQRAKRPNMPVRRDYQEFIQRAAERMKAK